MYNDNLKELTAGQLVSLVEGLRKDNTSKTQRMDTLEDRLLACKNHIDELKSETEVDRKKLVASAGLQKKIKELTIQNDGLSGLVDKKEQLISTLQRAIPTIRQENEKLRKMNKALIKKCAAAEQNLSNVVISGKLEKKACSSEKESIKTNMEGTIVRLEKRINGLVNKQKEDKLTMEKSILEKRKWERDMESLKEINKNQQEKLQTCSAEHERVVNRFSIVTEQMKNELSMKKAECKLLGEKLKEVEKTLEAYGQLAGGKPRPNSPVGKVLNSEKFAEVATLQSAVVENCEKVCPTDGKLNPKAFAAKLKLLF